MALPNLPQSRNEKYLAKIAGQEVELPNEPLSREEQYLDYIAKNGGGGGSYVLPTATELRLGGVKIGSGISVEEDGTISADIPTKVSELDNDEDFISDADYVHTDNNYDNTAKGIVDGVTEALAGKQDELTFDNIPTEDSINPVKSGGVYASDEAIRKWTTAEAKSVSGNPITLTDGSARNAEGLSVTCNPKQNLHGYDHPWAGGAGKNKLPMVLADIKSANTSGTWSGNVYTHNGVAFTLNTDDGDNIVGIKANGTATANAFIEIPVTTVSDGQIISGCPSGGSQSTYNLGFTTAGFPAYVDVGSGYALNSPLRGVSTKASIYIYSGVTANNLLFRPILELGSTATTFAPYSNECPITGLTECVVDRDGKNKLLLTIANLKAINTSGTWSGNAYTLKGVTFTVQTDEDGNVTGIDIDGTANNGNAVFLLSKTPVLEENTQYILNGCPTGGSGSTYNLQYSNMNNYAYTEIGSGIAIKKFDYTTYPDSAVTIRIIDGYSVPTGGLTFYPMIRLASVSDATYVPYSHYNVILAFGQTVYGAIVNPKTGKVTVDRVLKVFTGGNDENWHGNASWNNHTFVLENALSDAVSVSGYATVADITSNLGRAEAPGNLVTTALVVVKHGVGQGDGRSLYVNISDDLDTATKFKNYIASNPLQICYELATPIELTLSPAELELLKGYNYITTNGTTIALDYLPNSLLAEAENYVDAKIPPAPSSDGTYVLTCTVTDGTPAYSWESAT